MNNMISIICPVYNAEKKLDKCIQSVLGQTIPDFELILIDDGSKDGSSALCDQYAENDKRIKVIHTTNHGPSYARNIGLNNAKGKYVAFLDSDDFVEPEWLEYLLYDIDKYDLSVVGFTKEEMQEEQISDTTRIIEGGQCFQEVFDGEITTYLWNKLFKAEIISDEIRFDNNIYWCEDALFIAQYCGRITTAIIHSRKLYHYIENEGSIVHSGYNPKMLTFMDAYEQISELAKKPGKEKEIDVTICVHCQSLIYRIQNQNKPENKAIIQQLQQQIISRRSSLLLCKGRRKQRMLCLCMSYSVRIACAILRFYKNHN